MGGVYRNSKRQLRGECGASGRSVALDSARGRMARVPHTAVGPEGVPHGGGDGAARRARIVRPGRSGALHVRWGCEGGRRAKDSGWRQGAQANVGGVRCAVLS